MEGCENAISVAAVVEYTTVIPGLDPGIHSSTGSSISLKTKTVGGRTGVWHGALPRSNFRDTGALDPGIECRDDNGGVRRDDNSAGWWSGLARRSSPLSSRGLTPGSTVQLAPAFRSKQRPSGAGPGCGTGRSRALTFEIQAPWIPALNAGMTMEGFAGMTIAPGGGAGWPGAST